MYPLGANCPFTHDSYTVAALAFREHSQAVDAHDGSEQAHIPVKTGYTTPRDAIQPLADQHAETSVGGRSAGVRAAWGDPLTSGAFGESESGHARVEFRTDFLRAVSGQKVGRLALFGGIQRSEDCVRTLPGAASSPLVS